MDFNRDDRNDFKYFGNGNLFHFTSSKSEKMYRKDYNFCGCDDYKNDESDANYDNYDIEDENDDDREDGNSYLNNNYKSNKKEEIKEKENENKKLESKEFELNNKDNIMKNDKYSIFY